MRIQNHSQPFSKINEFLLYLFIFLLPTQLGKHFFFPWSFIQGVRIDYLSYVLYLTDIIAIFLFFFNIQKIRNFLHTKLFLIFILFAVLNICISSTPLISLYQWLKLFEILILYIVYKHNAISAKYILLVFFGSALIQASLATLQIIDRHTLQGIWYYFGERAITLSTPDIAKITLNGIEFLRPYGTFSHPNSLAGYFLLVLVFATFFPVFDRFFFIRQLLLIVCLYLVLFSFSQTAIIVYIGIQLLYALYWFRKTKCFMCLFPKMLIAIPVIFLLSQGGHDPQSIEKRIYLLSSAINIIAHNFVVGVGLGNYIYAQAKIPSLFYPYFLQPVHNIFLLLFSEVGIAGIAVCMQFISYWVTTISTHRTIQLLLLTVFLTGMVDHYWLTLQQNQLILGVVFGLAANQFLQVRKKNIVK